MNGATAGARRGTISPDNSTTAPLASGATFTGSAGFGSGQ